MSSTGIIDYVVKEVDEISYKAKVKPAITEEVINKFLDQILLLKELLRNQTKELSKLNDQVEKVTWVGEPIGEENLKKINNVIAKMKDLYSSLNRQILSLKPIKKKGIATKAINEFRAEVDGIRESYEDLESVFFFLPALPEFKEAQRIISLV